MSIEVIKVVKPEIDEPLLKANPESDAQIQLSVVVPAYREGRRIFSNLTRLVGELDKLKVAYEIVVVSDGNTDDTVSEAGRVESRAVVDQSVGDLVTFIDADMELDPANIAVFIDIMKSRGCDAVIGSKRHPQSQVAYPRLRRFQSAVYQLVVRLLFDLNVRDTQTGLKLFRSQVLKDAMPLLAIKRFAFDLELLVVANHLGYRNVCEAPIRLDYQFESTVNLGSAWRVLWDTAAIFYRLHILRYYDRRRRELAAAERHGEAPAGDTAEG